MKTMTGSLPSTHLCGTGRPRVALLVIVSLLLVTHFLLAVGGKRHESTTSDELAHLTAGFSYWRNKDYRLQPENGNLPQRWAALPAWLEGTKFPELNDNVYWAYSDNWVLGHQFFYETGQDHFPMLMAGRAMIALFSVATGLLVFWWSRRLFGDAGGIVSLVFFAFSPTMLAHGALATSDMCMTFFFLAAVGAWWWHLHDGRARVWWLSAVLFGLAFVAKYSAVFLVPMIVVMALGRALAPAPLALLGKTFTSRAGKFGAAALSGLGHGLVAFVLIWAFYGFRYSAFNPALPAAQQFIRSWGELEASLGNVGPMLHAARLIHLLPEAFLYGFAYVLETVKARGAFLNGEYSITGWPTFFLWAFWLKTTVPLLLASIITVFLVARRWAAVSATRLRADLYTVLPLAALFVIYWYSQLTSHLNIGQRHLMPIYPVLYIGVGALGVGLSARRWPFLTLVVALLGWQVTTAVRIAPHFLAYFNELAGGPANGYHHLVDSSLDWGQDLPGLKTWLDAHANGEPIYLSYFGTGEPAYYHLKVRRLAFLNAFKFPPIYEKLQPGIYCISATILMQVYGPGQGKWTTYLEDRYQRLRAFEPTMAAYSRDPRLRTQLERTRPPHYWDEAIAEYDQLRLARLCQYLQVRPPDANVGYSILIFRLNATELAAATTGTLADWSKLVEQASAAAH
ncbi:MAG: glycosyltransferase family 39 protein [Opitutaceae bacterium]